MSSPVALLHNVIWICFISFSCVFVSGDDLGRRAGHTAIRAGNQVVIHGGLVSDLSNRVTYNLQTQLIPLEESWNNSTLNMGLVERPKSYFGLENECLWLDTSRNIVYSFGGKLSAYENVKGSNEFYDDRTIPQSLWSLQMNKSERAWNRTLGPGAKSYPDILQTASGSCASDGKNGYNIGGATSSLSTPLVQNDNSQRNSPGLIKFNFDSYDLTNSTNDGDYFASRYTVDSKNMRYRIPGAMIPLPFGSEGLISLTGGQQGYGGKDNTRGAGWDNVTVYNPATESWYQQPTTGDIPTFSSTKPPGDWAFNQHCTFYAIDEAQKTVEIFVYGSFKDDPEIDTIFILSLPSFRWFKTGFMNVVRRKQMACVWAGINNQAIFIGGLDPDQNKSDTQNWNETADTWKQGVGVLDMTSVSLKDRYDADAYAYVAPDIVKAHYENGNRYPSTWVVKDLGLAFESWNLQQPKPPQAGLSRVKVVAITVSSVAATVLFVTALLLYRKKGQRLKSPFRRRRESASRAPSLSGKVRSSKESDCLAADSSINEHLRTDEGPHELLTVKESKPLQNDEKRTAECTNLTQSKSYDRDPLSHEALIPEKRKPQHAGDESLSLRSPRKSFSSQFTNPNFQDQVS